MKAYGELEVKLQAFLALVLNGVIVRRKMLRFSKHMLLNGKGQNSNKGTKRS
jgi:hypothetical protein